MNKIVKNMECVRNKLHLRINYFETSKYFSLIILLKKFYIYIFIFFHGQMISAAKICNIFLCALKIKKK